MLDELIWVHQRASELLEEFGLLEQGWKFKVSNTKRFVGRCFHDDKIIEVSQYYLHNDKEEIEDTIRHEIAHAVCGKGHGHGDYWMMTAIDCGARPERLAPPEVQSSAKPKYRLRCSKCSKSCGTRHRLRRSQLEHYASPCCDAPLAYYRILYK